MEVRKLGVSPKLEYIFEVHFLVKEKVSELDFIIQVDRAGSHHIKLKLYEGDHTPNWEAKARRKVVSHTRI